MRVLSQSLFPRLRLNSNLSSIKAEDSLAGADSIPTYNKYNYWIMPENCIECAELILKLIV